MPPREHPRDQPGPDPAAGAREKKLFFDVIALLVLDKNPLAVEPMAIRDLVVLETWKAGKSIYRREK